MTPDPWRYTCPDCGSHSVTYMFDPHNKKRVNKSVPPGGRWRNVELGTYRCQECSARLPEVYDKKRGVLADPGASLNRSTSP